MFVIKEVHDKDKKATICNEILRALPDWFGIESSIRDYVEQVKTQTFFVAFHEKKAVGFVSLRMHNRFTAEVYVMGVLVDYHRQGIGKNLIKCCEEYCRENGKEFLTVKTLDESRENDSYKKTRLFYLSEGFVPLEVFPLFWDEDNPCLFMAKHID